MKNLLLYVLLSLGCRHAAPLPVAPPDPAQLLKQAREGEILRTLSAADLKSFLAASDVALEQVALQAAARLTLDEALDTVAAKLNHADAEIRWRAAFALGQYGVRWQPTPESLAERATAAVVAAVAGESNERVRDALLEALGKLGRPSGLTVLVRELAAPDGNRVRAAIALGVAAKNSGGKSVVPLAVPLLVARLQDSDEATRLAAAYALYRYRDAAALGPLIAALSDRSAEIRATVVKAIGQIAAPERSLLFATPLFDSDERVAAEAARSLAELAKRCPSETACAPIGTLANSVETLPASALVALTAETFSQHAAAPLFFRLFQKWAPNSRDRDDTRVRLQCRAALAHDRALGRLALVPICGGERSNDRALLVAQFFAGGRGDETALGELTALSKHSSAEVRTQVAVDLGARSDGPSGELLGALLDDNDPAVVSAVAEAIEKRQLRPLSERLRARLHRLQGPDRIEPVQALLQTLAALGVGEAVSEIQHWLTDANFSVRLAAAQALSKLTAEPLHVPTVADDGSEPQAELRADTVVRIETVRGILRLRFFADDAPRTARNFVSLVKRHFYDSLTFHRVVPGFVVQGGDPRGDGSGGPGYTIPCEINQHRYQAGTVGMALSGRDTGGSQFFISTTAQPHLDGRYTAFGELISGLDVAVRLLPGDRILSATVE